MNHYSILSSSETIRDISHNAVQYCSKTPRYPIGPLRGKRFSLLRFPKDQRRDSASISRETLRIPLGFKDNPLGNDNMFNWLAGLIDADGGFYVSKAHYCSCEITMHTKEIQTLHYVKALCGGSVQNRTSSNSVRWRLHNQAGMIQLCLNLNGRLQTTAKQIQFLKVCHALGTKADGSARSGLPKGVLGDSIFTQNPSFGRPVCLSTASSWLSGFFTGDGHFNLNRNHFQASVAISQKDRAILDKIQLIWGGTLYYDKSWHGWVWAVSEKRQLKLILAYFNINSLHNPYKIAKLKGFERYLRYLERGDHLHHTTSTRLIKYIDWFQREI